MAKKSIWIGLIIGIAGLALGCLAGFAIGQSSMAAYKKAVTYWPMDLQAPGMHSHNKMNVPAGVKPPTIRIEVLPDMMKAHNYTLRLVTENFRFAPEAVSMKAVQGEGHAHLYIDDVLISRIYGEWQHIPSLKPGKHEIYVTLNYNNHDEFAIGGQTIGARTTVE
jgi:hypothetical protein